MPALFGGIAILGGLLLLAYLFVNADPAKLARDIKWIVFGLALVLSVALLFTGRIIFLWLPLGLLLPYLWPQVFRRPRGRPGKPAGSLAEIIATPLLRVRLDRGSGAIGGTVLAGPFTGMRLDELTFDDLMALLHECRISDEEGAGLLEAYLDRRHPKWRDRNTAEPPRHAASPDIGVDEAYAILGLSRDADDAAIRAAHERLITQLDPEHGGSEYLARQINQARDVLLKRKPVRE